MSINVVESPKSSRNANESTFSRLCKLQKLIQKESAIKKLCKY